MCVALETHHTNTSSCTHGAGGDTPQLAPREADLQRDMQDNSRLFWNQTPQPLGRDPVGGSQRRLAELSWI